MFIVFVISGSNCVNVYLRAHFGVMLIWYSVNGLKLQKYNHYDIEYITLSLWIHMSVSCVENHQKIQNRQSCIQPHLECNLKKVFQQKWNVLVLISVSLKRWTCKENITITHYVFVRKSGRFVEWYIIPTFKNKKLIKSAQIFVTSSKHFGRCPSLAVLCPFGTCCENLILGTSN